MFIILFRPQLNTREYLRASRANHTMKSSQNDDSQQRETISQLMINEFSGECSYNHVVERDDSSVHIFTPVDNAENRREISVQVSESFLNSKISKSVSFRSNKRTLSLSHINEIAVFQEEKSNSLKVNCDVKQHASESKLPRIEVDADNSNRIQSPSSSSESIRKGKNAPKRLASKSHKKSKSECFEKNKEAKDDKCNNHEPCSSDEIVHEIFINEKPTDEDVQGYRIQSDEEISETNVSEKSDRAVTKKEDICSDSDIVYFKVVACAENVNAAKLGYMTLIVDSELNQDL